MKFLLIITVLIATFNSANAACDKICAQGQNHLCNGEKSFVLCRNGQPGTAVYQCPPQYFCVNTNSRCELNAIPTCRSGCAVCNPTTGIACLSKKVFAFCFGNTVPNLNVTGSCDNQGDFCNANVPEMCSREYSCDSDDIVRPTSSTPTGSTPADIMAFCRRINQGGKFTPAGDKICKKYNYCYIHRGEIMGKQYSCPGDLLFDCQTQQCSEHCNNNCQIPGLFPPPLFRNT